MIWFENCSGFLESVAVVWLIPCQVQPELNQLMDQIAAAVSPDLLALPDPKVGDVAIAR